MLAKPTGALMMWRCLPQGRCWCGGWLVVWCRNASCSKCEVGGGFAETGEVRGALTPFTDIPIQISTDIPIQILPIYAPIEFRGRGWFYIQP